MDSRFHHDAYLIRKHILSLAGAKLEIFDAGGMSLFFSKMKAFKLKEDIRLYSREDMQEEFLAIRARSIIDFSATYDVIDTPTNQKIGSLRRHGMKSLLQDEWSILDQNDNQIGTIKESNLPLALLRRFISFIPQTFSVEINDRRVGEIKQNLNPLVGKLKLNFAMDVHRDLDRRMGLAAGIVLCVIEGKQD